MTAHHFPKLQQLFKTAMENKIAKPTFRLGEFKFSKAAKGPLIYVTDHGPYGNNRYFGKMMLDTGEFFPVYSTTKEELAAILAVAENPAAGAKAYGRKTGTCCICGRALINKDSVRLMIGPICLEKVGFSFQDLIDDQEDDGQLSLKDI